MPGIDRGDCQGQVDLNLLYNHKYSQSARATEVMG